MDRARQVLKETFGFDDFRLSQAQVLDTHDVEVMSVDAVSGAFRSWSGWSKTMRMHSSCIPLVEGNLFAIKSLAYVGTDGYAMS